MKPGNGLFCRIPRRQALLDIVICQQSDGFCVSFSFKCNAIFGKFFAQFAKILDNPVVDNSDLTGTVGMGI